MDEVTSNLKPKKKLVFYLGIFLGILVLVFGIYYGVSWYRNPERQYAKQEKIVEDAYRNDTYGGKTPQETLDLFVAALKQGDVDLASKYFALDDNLSRKKWEDLLNEVRKQDALAQMANDLAKYNESKKSIDNYYLFLYRDSDGKIGLQLTMIFDLYSGVWKIESL